MRKEKTGLFFIVAAAFALSGVLFGEDIFERLGYAVIGSAIFIAGILYDKGKWRQMGNFMIGAAAFLSNIMCIHVTCIYFALSDRYYGGGMPRNAAFYWGIPYLFLMAGCFAAAWFCHKKARMLQAGKANAQE